MKTTVSSAFSLHRASFDPGHRALRAGLAFWLACGGAFGAAQVQAAKIEMLYSGYVYFVDDGAAVLNGLAANGTSTKFTGGFVYDTAVADSDGRPNFGFFENVNSGFFVNFGNGLLFQQGGAQSYNNIQIGDERTDFDNPNDPFDGFYAYGNLGVADASYAESGVSLQAWEGLAGPGLPLSLDFNPFLGACSDGGALNAAHPDVKLPCAEMEFHLTANDGDQTDVFGVIEGLRIRQVPEPATFGLLGIGLLAVGFARRRG